MIYIWLEFKKAYCDIIQSQQQQKEVEYIASKLLKKKLWNEEKMEWKKNNSKDNKWDINIMGGIIWSKIKIFGTLNLIILNENGLKSLVKNKDEEIRFLKYKTKSNYNTCCVLKTHLKYVSNI